MITRNQFEEIYPLVNEIVAFSDSFANEDNSLFRYFKTMGKVYGSNDLIKIIRSNILSDLLHCYFTLGYQQNYNSNCYVLFDLLQYAFWFDTNHFSYEDGPLLRRFSSRHIMSSSWTIRAESARRRKA